MTIWFVSDEHYDHANILLYANRPFNTVNHMQSVFVANHNSIVKPEDEVYHLGDFSMNEKTVPIILPQLNGRHTLVHGNHDRTFPTHKHHEAATQRYLQYGFVGVYQELHNFHGFHLCHLPHTEEGKHGQKFAEWRPTANRETYLLHGHVHNSWKVNGKQINVGVDQWNYFPVSLDEIKALVERERLREKTGTL
jgi:calcineurin-like phosphoesterase family protein